MGELHAGGRAPRSGDRSRCPACGTAVDASVYRCARCLVYFCFKCRRRVPAKEDQFQCLNQMCERYGKLVCEFCLELQAVMGEFPKKELVSEGIAGYRKTTHSRRFVTYCALATAAIVVGLGFGLDLCCGISWWWTLPVAAFISYRESLYLMDCHTNVAPVPAVYRDIVEPAFVGNRKICGACRQSVARL